VTVCFHPVAGPSSPALPPEQRRLFERLEPAVDDITPLKDELLTHFVDTSEESQIPPSNTDYHLLSGLAYISATAPEVVGVATEPDAQPERQLVGPPLHFESSGLPTEPQVGLLPALRTRSRGGHPRIRWYVVVGLVSTGPAALHQIRVPRRAVRLVRDTAAAIDCWWSR
jgi:hypothetical protein